MRVLLLSLVLAAPALAQPAVTGYGEFAVEVGGDDVIELLFTNGGSQTLTAGQGGTLAAGVRVQPSPAVPLSAFASLGFKFLLNASDNANIRLTRIPVELGARYAITPDVWAEAAYTRHLATSLKGDGFFRDVDFESSNGGTVAAGWRWVGATYTALRYTADDGTEFDASSVGLVLRLSSDDF